MTPDEFKQIEPIFKAVLKELHDAGQLYMYATDREIMAAARAVRARRKRKIKQ